MNRERLGVPNASEDIISKVEKFDISGTLFHLYDEDSGGNDASCFKLYSF